MSKKPFQKIEQPLKVEEFTFGKNKADVTLALILNQRQDRRLSWKIGSFLAALSRHLKNIEIKDDSVGTKEILWHLFRNSTVQLIDQMLGNDPEIITYVKNCAITRIKKYILKT